MEKFKLAYNVTHIGHCLMALSPGTPPEVLEKLLNIKDPNICSIILNNLNSFRYNKTFIYFQEYLKCYEHN